MIEEKLYVSPFCQEDEEEELDSGLDIEESDDEEDDDWEENLEE
jgi:hypothetical protein